MAATGVVGFALVGDGQAPALPDAGDQHGGLGPDVDRLGGPDDRGDRARLVLLGARAMRLVDQSRLARAAPALRLPAHVYERLHESRWVEGVGAYLTAAEVDRIFTDDDAVAA